jgi:hypothetical protein
MTLERKETQRGHSYKLDGKKVQGVTTLLNGGLPKPALVQWAARSVAEWVADNGEALDGMRGSLGRDALVAALKQTPYEARDMAAARGTDVHALAEEILHGREVEVPENLAAYVDGYVRLIDQWQMKPLVTEKPVASRKWWYAGTFDAIVEIGAGEFQSQTALLDWKTSKGVYGETALQLAAYRNAEFYLDDGVEVPMPKVDHLGVVHVTPFGSDLYIISEEHSQAAWSLFQYVQYIAKNAETTKKFLGEPLPAPEAVLL